MIQRLLIVLIAFLSIVLFWTFAQAQETGLFSIHLPTIRNGYNWNTECVDCLHEIFLGDRQLRIDTQGKAHLVYGGDNLYYAWEDENNHWQVEIADRRPLSGQFPSLVLDEHGWPHIVYRNHIVNELGLFVGFSINYAWKDASGWHIQPLELGLDELIRLISPVVIDEQGNIHVGFITGENPKQAFYAYQDAYGWHQEMIEPAGYGRIIGISIDLEPTGIPCATYFVEEEEGSKEVVPEQKEIRLACKRGEKWEIEVIDQWWARSRTDGQVSLTIDEAGNPWIAYVYSGGLTSTGNFANIIRTAHRFNETWVIEDFREGVNLSLAPAPNGHIALSVVDSSGNLIYALRQERSWLTETVAAGIQSSVLELDDRGKPHIAFLRNGNLGYTHPEGSAWQFYENIDQSGRSRSASLAVDNLGQYHAAFKRDQTDIFYAQRTAQNMWIYEKVFYHCEYPCSDPELAVGPDGVVHIIYAEDGELMYAWREDSRWQIEQVPGIYPWANIEDPSLIIDSLGKPHIAISGSEGLYAWKESDDWHTENVDPDGYIVDLAMDAGGHAHLSYASLPDKVHYAYQGQHGWELETLSDPGNGTRVSIATDQDSRPHITYVSSSGQLKFATRTGQGWVTETVLDNVVFYGSHTAGPELILTEEGRPFIILRDRILTKVSSRWIPIEFGMEWLPLDTSLAISPLGGLGVLYWDIMGDILFAISSQ